MAEAEPLLIPVKSIFLIVCHRRDANFRWLWLFCFETIDSWWPSHRRPIRENEPNSEAMKHKITEWKNSKCVRRCHIHHEVSAHQRHRPCDALLLNYKIKSPILSLAWQWAMSLHDSQSAKRIRWWEEGSIRCDQVWERVVATNHWMQQFDVIEWSAFGQWECRVPSFGRLT